MVAFARVLLGLVHLVCPTVTLVWADGGYAGQSVETAKKYWSLTIQILKRPDTARLQRPRDRPPFGHSTRRQHMRAQSWPNNAGFADTPLCDQPTNSSRSALDKMTSTGHIGRYRVGWR